MKKYTVHPKEKNARRAFFVSKDERKNWLDGAIEGRAGRERLLLHSKAWLIG